MDADVNKETGGNLNDQMRGNPKFQLTSAEIHVISYYGSQNEPEKDSSENTSDTRDGI